MSSFNDRSTLSLVWQILERKDKWRLSFVFVLILFGTVLEMASIGVVIPVVQAVVVGDQRSKYEWLPPVLRDGTYQFFVQLLMLTLVLTFILKNLFLLASNYYQQRVQFSISNRVIQGLFHSYLRQPYEFHLKHSSSLLVRNVQEYSASIIGGAITPFLLIATESIAGIGLLTILFLVDASTTLLILALFVATAITLLRLSRTKTRRWGAEKVVQRGIILESLLSGFGGIKEIKVFGRDQEVLNAHQFSLYRAARVSYLFALAQSAPRALFEVAAVASVGLSVAGAVWRGADLKNSVTTIALFGFVAFRMLPSVNKVVTAAQTLSYGRTGIEGAATGLQLVTPNVPEIRDTKREPFTQLQATAIKYQYPNSETVVIDIDTLTLRSGESLGIVGVSGSGKSTLVDLLIGILAPNSGHITVNDRRINEDPRYWQDRIGYVPQHVFLMDTTVRRNVAFGLSDKEINAPEVERALRSANLWEFVQTLPQGLETVVGERGVRLSGGQRQRLGIARALYGGPEVIVLDEATSALDEDTEREIVESMREISRNRTLIVVAHRTSTLAYCTRLIRLDAGRIVQEGTFEEVVGSLPNA